MAPMKTASTPRPTLLPASLGASSAADADTSTPKGEPVTSSSKKRKRKQTTHMIHAQTIRAPRWTYFHLSLLTPSLPSSTSTSPSSTTASLDTLTTSSLLTTPLQSYLGLLGSSIPIDILHVSGLAIHIRIPREDSKGFRAAISSWTGSVGADMVPGCAGKADKWGRVRCSWRVLGEAQSLDGLNGDGADLFRGG